MVSVPWDPNELRKLARLHLINILTTAPDGQLSPNPLIDAVIGAIRQSNEDRWLTANDKSIIETVMWVMISRGELLWLKEGPIRLKDSEPESGYVYQVEINGQPYSPLYASPDSAKRQLESGIPPNPQEPLTYRELESHEQGSGLVLAGAGYWKHLSVVRRAVLP